MPGRTNKVLIYILMIVIGIVIVFGVIAQFFFIIWEIFKRGMGSGNLDGFWIN